jgi:hypothetical protein
VVVKVAHHAVCHQRPSGASLLAVFEPARTHEPIALLFGGASLSSNGR